jgi:hypothetical protein
VLVSGLTGLTSVADVSRSRIAAGSASSVSAPSG